MKIGLIGYGFMGGAHATAIAAMPDATLVAVSSRTRPSADGPVRGNLDLKATPLSDEVHWTSNWQEIVDDPSIDAIDICLPTHMHRQVIERAFATGKHVLCEKPMALTQPDCEALLAQAKASGRTFMVAQVLRWMFPYRYALAFVRQAGPEAITSCTLQRSTGFPHWSEWLGRQDVSGGATLDLLSHDLDQALQWFGEPQSVSALSMGPVDTTRAQLHYSWGLQVMVEGGWLAPETPFSCSYSIATTDQTLNLSSGKLHTTSHRKTSEVDLPQEDPYAEEIAYFLQCCRTGEPPVMCPPADSARAVTLALLVDQSRQQNGRELSWQ